MQIITMPQTASDKEIVDGEPKVDPIQCSNRNPILAAGRAEMAMVIRT